MIEGSICLLLSTVKIFKNVSAFMGRVFLFMRERQMIDSLRNTIMSLSVWNIWAVSPKPMLDSRMLLQHNLQTNVLSFDYCLNAIPKWDEFLDSVQTLPSFTAPSGPTTHRLIYTSTGLFWFFWSLPLANHMLWRKFKNLKKCHILFRLLNCYFFLIIRTQFY